MAPLSTAMLCNDFPERNFLLLSKHAGSFLAGILACFQGLAGLYEPLGKIMTSDDDDDGGGGDGDGDDDDDNDDEDDEESDSYVYLMNYNEGYRKTCTPYGPGKKA
jgi:hypothetical protein